jgi:hypothetical protein
MPMLFLSFFQWWYGPGWRQVHGAIGTRVVGVIAAFSVPQLLKTLFAPWRRIITYPGASLEARFKAWGDNLVSRVIGFFVRLFVLLGAGVSLTVVLILSVAELLAWPLLPLMIPVFLILAVVA